MMINRKKRLSLKVLRTFVAALLAALLLSGCLLERIKVVRTQFCDYENNFTVEIGERAGFVFQNPVFLSSDVKFLSGHEPTEIYRTNNQLQWRYLIEKWSSDPASREQHPVDLYFMDMEGEQKLSRIEYPIMMGSFMTPEIMTSTAADICNTDWKRMSRTVEQQISDEQMAMLPSRKLLLSMLGTPTDVVDDGKGMFYEFRIVEPGQNSVISELTIWYEADDTIPTRMASRTDHVNTRADFGTRKLTMRYGL